MTILNPGETRNLRGVVSDAHCVKSCLGSNT